MTPDPATAAWLAEMWPTVREVAIDERITKRKEDRREQRELEERAVHSSPEGVHSFVDDAPTGNPEIALSETDKGAA